MPNIFRKPERPVRPFSRRITILCWSPSVWCAYSQIQLVHLLFEDWLTNGFSLSVKARFAPLITSKSAISKCPDLIATWREPPSLISFVFNTRNSIDFFRLLSNIWLFPFRNNWKVCMVFPLHYRQNDWASWYFDPTARFSLNWL